jgi:uridine phosphorylase
VTYPRVAGKHAFPAVVSPAEHAEYVRVTFNGGRPPIVSKAVLLYQGKVLRRLVARLPCQEKKGWVSGELWMTGAESGLVAVCGRFGKGAPAAGLVVEQLIGLGARQIISVGTAGGLVPHLERGDIVVCDRAIRDEGLSYHYLPDAKYCAPSQELTGRLSTALRAANQRFYTGTSWSTDAPYRETAREVSVYRAENALTVDMEAAGIFAVGQFRDVRVAAAFGVSDIVRDRCSRRLSADRQCGTAIDHLVDAALRALRVADDHHVSVPGGRAR